MSWQPISYASSYVECAIERSIISCDNFWIAFKWRHGLYGLNEEEFDLSCKLIFEQMSKYPHGTKCYDTTVKMLQQMFKNNADIIWRMQNNDLRQNNHNDTDIDHGIAYNAWHDNAQDKATDWMAGLSTHKSIISRTLYPVLRGMLSTQTALVIANAHRKKRKKKEQNSMHSSAQ